MKSCAGTVRRFAAVLLMPVLVAACATTGAPSDRTLRAESDREEVDRRASVRLELASLYFSRGQGATALDEIKRALTFKPDMPEAYNLRGLVLASMGDPLQAEESFQRALQLGARDGATMHNYGWFLCQQRRYTEAEAQFQAAVALPQYRDTVRTLLAQGVCQARAGRWAEAERTLSRSYELDPSSPVAAYNLGDVLLHRGELERARFYVGRINAVPEYVTAQSLWLAARIERRLGNESATLDFGRRLRDRFPDSTEALQFERGRFDE